MSLHKASDSLHLAGTYGSRPVRNGDVRLQVDPFNRVVRLSSGVASHMIRIIGLPNCLLTAEGGSLALPGTSNGIVERAMSDYVGFDEDFIPALEDPSHEKRIRALRRHIESRGLPILSSHRGYDRHLEQQLKHRTSMGSVLLREKVLLPLAIRHVARERQDVAVDTIIAEVTDCLIGTFTTNPKAFIPFIDGRDRVPFTTTLTRRRMRDIFFIGPPLSQNTRMLSDEDHLQTMEVRQCWFIRVCEMIRHRLKSEFVKDLVLIGWKGLQGFRYSLGRREVFVAYDDNLGLSVRIGARGTPIDLSYLETESGALLSGLKLLSRKRVQKIGGLLTSGEGWEEIE
jgi:hypothetical protein